MADVLFTFNLRPSRSSSLIPATEQRGCFRLIEELLIKLVQEVQHRVDEAARPCICKRYRLSNTLNQKANKVAGLGFSSALLVQVETTILGSVC